MNESEIRRFFDTLHDAAGFTFVTTAVEEVSPGESGPKGFEEYVLLHLGWWMDHWLDTAECLTFASLETRHRRRTFQADPGESFEAFARRIQHEAQWLEDPWLFAATIGDPPEGVDTTYGTGSESERGTRRFAQFGVWYAEARGRGVTDRVHGVMLLDDGRARLVAGEDEDAVDPLFADILRGHPARRRHPLRVRPGSLE